MSYALMVELLAQSNKDVFVHPGSPNPIVEFFFFFHFLSCMCKDFGMAACL